MTALAIIHGVSLAIFAVAIWRAPLGYQTETGFYLGDGA
jgi:hypothetical protein